MNINTKYKIGQMVKVYFTPIKESKITKEVSCRYGIISEIKISLDKVTNQPMIMYRLVGKPDWYSEHTLVRYS